MTAAVLFFHQKLQNISLNIIVAIIYLIPFVDSILFVAFSIFHLEEDSHTYLKINK